MALAFDQHDHLTDELCVQAEQARRRAVVSEFEQKVVKFRFAAGLTKKRTFSKIMREFTDEGAPSEMVLPVLFEFCTKSCK